MNTNVLTDKFSEPLNGKTAARINIQAGDGNLTIDPLTSGETVLASGALQYTEKQGPPTRILDANHDQASLTLKGSQAGQPWFRFPWSACNGATEWQIQLNPSIPSDITAHSDGGNVKLNLSSMRVTRVLADTGGGNMEVVLPDDADNLSVTAKTGAGDVDVRIPSGIAARIHATTGLGKAIVDPRFSRTENNTYQSPDFDSAANRVEITVHSGAGNVNVSTT